jgi:hypothetical protein
MVPTEIGAIFRRGLDPTPDSDEIFSAVKKFADGLFGNIKRGRRNCGSSGPGPYLCKTSESVSSALIIILNGALPRGPPKLFIGGGFIGRKEAFNSKRELRFLIGHLYQFPLPIKPARILFPIYRAYSSRRDPLDLYSTRRN